MAESDGTLEDTIIVRKDILTELEYSFNVSLRSGDIPAMEGVQYLHTVLYNSNPPPLSFTHILRS